MTAITLPGGIQLPASITPETAVAVLVALITLVVLTILAKGSSSSQAAALRKARKDIREMLNRENCGPIMIRLAWHDSGE